MAAKGVADHVGGQVIAVQVIEGGVHRLVVVGRGAQVVHLPDARSHDVLSDVDGNSELGVDVLMQVQRLAEGDRRGGRAGA